MKPVNAKRERGAALLAMLAVVMLVGSWFLVSRLNAESGTAQAIYKARNTEVLNRAKQALIGYVAAQAAKAYEDHPGALPCPEAAGYFDSTTQDGQIASSCTLPKVGRFPWRTIGTDKLVDAFGEPLWYVVSPGWAYTSGTGPVINSNTNGQLTVDGVANDAVALIIAPGPAIRVAASTGCTVFSQVRPTTGTPDWRNYLECENATYPTPDATFVTRGASGSFNDQVVRITAAEILPAIEAAIANRIEREIAPALKSVYSSSNWLGVTAGKSVYPYAAPFPSGVITPSTSTYRGTVGNYHGLLPFFQTQNCNPATDVRCNTTLLTFSKASADVQTGGAGSIRTQSTCAWVSTDYVCTGEYLQPTITVAVSVRVTNVARGLRALDSGQITFTAKDDAGAGSGPQNVSFTASTTMNSDGSGTITATGTPPTIASMSWGTYANYVVSFGRGAMGDHSLLDSTDSLTGWFVRNEWYRLVYYATVQKRAAIQLASGPLGCSGSSDCLTVTTNTTPATNRSAVLVLAGRSINGSSRPSSSLADYLEFKNVSGYLTGSYEKQTVAGSASTAHPDMGIIANAYAIPATIATDRAFQFKAVNANTAASTLSTTNIAAKSLRNSDGSSLSASQIQAGAVVEATYDGTQFTLTKRPFNDRVIIVDTN